MEKIFSTRERIKILQAIIFKTGNISVNNIAGQLRLSKGLVSKYFDILTRKNILKRVNGKFIVKDSPLVKGIKILFNVKNADTGILKRFSFVQAAGLYGSCAKGENNEDSDIDLWIRVADVSEEKLASLTSELTRSIKNSKPLFLTTRKIERVRKDDPLFYHSLVFGSVILYGGEDGIQI